MSKSVIQVKSISKEYKISHEFKAAPGTLTFKDSIRGIARKPIELITGHKLKKENFWALKDINFEVEQGEVLGIIGKNGSGKSTLLKILSRIVEPTTGEIRMQGRVASLLEVGTGFHPELTGRENIYFNGSILGMKKKEIEARFDDIVAFSEVEKFLDTPVKFYSSGMYVRLAFAVAAHLEPDILIIDEVLAVGDVSFQKKCLGKMKDVAGEGRTVLFVSHSMTSIQQLCTKAIYLDKGRIEAKGRVVEVIDRYFNDQGVRVGSNTWSRSDNTFDSDYIKPCLVKVPRRVKAEDGIEITLELDIKKTDPLLNIGVGIYDESGNLLFWTFSTDLKEECWPKLKKGHNFLKLCIPPMGLNEGTYTLELMASLFNKKWILPPEASPRVVVDVISKYTESPYWIQKRPGLLAPKIKWSNK